MFWMIFEENTYKLKWVSFFPGTFFWFSLLETWSFNWSISYQKIVEAHIYKTPSSVSSSPKYNTKGFGILLIFQCKNFSNASKYLNARKKKTTNKNPNKHLEISPRRTEEWKLTTVSFLRYVCKKEVW